MVKVLKTLYCIRVMRGFISMFFSVWGVFLCKNESLFGKILSPTCNFGKKNRIKTKKVSHCTFSSDVCLWCTCVHMCMDVHRVITKVFAPIINH